MEGHIKLYRKFTEWEWYSDANTCRIFLHILIMANWQDKKWKGIEIQRGQFLSSYEKIGEELKLSRQQVRTSVSKLILTNEITTSASSKYTVFTVVKYDLYQMSNQVDNHQVTNKQPTSNHQITTTKNYKNYKNNKNDNKRDIKSVCTPPTLAQIKAYCQKEKIQIDEEKFFNHYSSVNWYVGNNKMKNWKARVRMWAKDDAGHNGMSANAGSNGTSANKFTRMSSRNDNSGVITALEKLNSGGIQ